MQLSWASAVLSATTYSTFAAAAIVSHCPMNDVCYQVGVPEVSASSGSGNLYLQLRAPTTYTWVALGTGTQMSGANIFLMYADGTRNVTVSARKGTGHVQPQHQTETKLELLAGSGIVDNGNTMLANLRCANCESWSGGSMRLSDTSAPFLAAWQKGKALNTKNLEATITQHDDESRFTFDLAKATVADDANPFVQASNGGTGGGGTTTPPPISGGPGSDDAGSALPAWLREIPTIRTAHGTLMSIVMVVLYPLGSVLMPLSGNWVLHAVWQLVSFLAMWAAFGLGVILAQRTGYGFHEHHTLLGAVVVSLFGVQPFGGYIHHRYYVKYQKRGLVSYGHIWYGRTLIILGIVNGGLGLQLAGASRSLIIAYSVVAAVIFTAYAGGAVWGELRRRRRGTGAMNRGWKSSA
ncbi:iron reductase domain protein [Nemania serpens]|nr:iron reductase domain protein [Nemania serpens]